MRRQFIYGPVPSRRLGFSLGADIIPAKTCTLDCVYCQLGRTTRKTVKRIKGLPAAAILSQIKKAISSGQRIDFITFSGSGEPTLVKSLGSLIGRIKRLTDTPVAVITNGTLFTRKEVRQALRRADLVVPSLDAASANTFVGINRPHPRLNLEKIIRGLRNFRKEFRGRIWLEIMLVKGVNDSPAELRQLKKLSAMLAPDRIHLNTPVRPPAERWVEPLSMAELKKVKKLFGRNSEIVADFGAGRQESSSQKAEERILAYLRRRPATVKDLSATTGYSSRELGEPLQRLLEKGKIRSGKHKGRLFFQLGRQPA